MRKSQNSRTIAEQHQHHNTNVHDRFVSKLQSRDVLSGKTNKDGKAAPRNVLQPYPYYPALHPNQNFDEDEEVIEEEEQQPPVPIPEPLPPEEQQPPNIVPENNRPHVVTRVLNPENTEVEPTYVTEGGEVVEEVSIDEEKLVKVKGTPFHMVVPPGEKHPVILYHGSDESKYGLYTNEKDLRDPSKFGKRLPRALVLIDFGGMRIPFYSSNGKNGPKYDTHGPDKNRFVVQGDWLPLFGMDGWFNKNGKGRSWFDGWGVPEVAQVQKALAKIWPRRRLFNSSTKDWVRPYSKTNEYDEFWSQTFLENQDRYPKVPWWTHKNVPEEWHSSTDKVIEDLHALFGRGKAKDPKEEPPKPPLDVDMAFKYAEEAGIDKFDVIINKKTGVVEEIRMGDKVIKQPDYGEPPINYKMYESSSVITTMKNDEEARRAGAPTPACEKCGNYHDKRLECPIRVLLPPHERFGYVAPKQKVQQVILGGGGRGGGGGRRMMKNPPRKSNSNDTSSAEVMQSVSPVVWAPASEPPTKMAVFDIDDTLLDTSQRMRSAIRMGLFDPRQKGKKSHPKGVQAFRDFFYSPDRFDLDSLIPGALDLVNSLQQQGYTIAYCTGRPRRIFEATKNQLRRHGFPIMRDKNGFELLAMKPDTDGKTTSYKFNVLRDLQHRYDVRMFFDNHPGNLAEAQKLGIPGLYISIDQYSGIQGLADRFKQDKRKVMDDIKRNPVAFPVPESYKQRLAKQLGEEMTSEGYHPLVVQEHFIDSGAYHGNKSDFEYVQGEYQEFLDEIEAQDWDEAYAEYSDVESHLAYYMYTNYGISMPVYTHSHIRGVLFRVKLFEAVMKHFKLKFDPKYLVKGSNYKKVFKVRTALELAAKDQNKKLPKITDEKLMAVVNSKIEEVKQNPPQTFTKTKVNNSVKGTKIQKKPDSETGNNCHSCAYWKPVGTVDGATREVGLCSLWSDKVNREVLTGDTFYCGGWKQEARDNPGGALPIFIGEPNTKFKNLGAVFSEIQIGRNIVKDVGEVVQSIYRGLAGGRTSMAEKRMAMAIASMQKELSDRATDKGGNALANLHIDYELIDQSATLTLIGTADAIKMTSPPKNNPNFDLPSKTKLSIESPRSMEYLVGRTNPLPKPKKGMKKPEKYVEYLMGHTKMRTEFPDRRQRYAVALSLVEKNMKSGRNWARHRGLKKTVQKKQLKRLKGTAEALNNPGGDPVQLYESFNGQPPDEIKRVSVEMPTTLVRIGEGGCWSVGYRSDKEGHGDDQKYIHNFGDFGRFPKKKPKPGDRKEPDLYAAMDENGNVVYLVIMGGTFSLETDPDSGVNWLVG